MVQQPHQDSLASDEVARAVLDVVIEAVSLCLLPGGLGCDVSSSGLDFQLGPNVIGNTTFNID